MNNKDAKISAFVAIKNSNRPDNRAMKAGVFLGYEGVYPTCLCTNTPYQHSNGCRLDDVMAGYELYQKFLRELAEF